MITHAEFLRRLSGDIHYGSGHEREIALDPYCAFDPDDPYGEYSGAYFTVRIVASWFHGGQGRALYSLASAGGFDRDALLAELAGASCGELDELVREACDCLRDWIEGAPADTSEEPCTDHGLETCPDCGNAGTAIGPDGYYQCTRFLTCWADVSA